MALLFACDICLEDLPLERFLFYKCGHGYCSICIPQISGKTCPTCRKSLRKDNIPHRVYVTPVNTAEERADYLGHALNALGPESSTSAMNVAKLGMKMKSVAEELRVDQVTSSKLLAISNNMNERIAPLLFQLQEQKRAFQHSLPRVQLRADRAEKEAESLKQQLMEKTVTLVDKEKAYRDLWGCFEAQRRENERLKQMFAGIESTRGEAVHWDQNTQGSSQVANQTPVNPQPRPKNPEALKHILKILQILNAIHRKRNTPLPPALLGIPSPNYDPATSPFKDIQLGPTPGTIHVADKSINIYALFAAVLSRGGAATLTSNNAWSTLLPHFRLPEQHSTPDRCSLINVPEVLRHHYNLIFGPMEHLYLRKRPSAQTDMHDQTAASLPPRLDPPNARYSPVSAYNVNPHAASTSSLTGTSYEGHQEPFVSPSSSYGIKRKSESEESIEKAARLKIGPPEPSSVSWPSFDPSYMGPAPRYS